MINWILQKNLTKPAILKRIKSAVNQDGENWEEIEVIPFSNQLARIQNKDAFHVIYGSTTFMLLAYEVEELRAGLFFDPAKFQMQNYVKQWQEQVLNHKGNLILLGELANMESPPQMRWFIRPNSDGKAFSGRVHTFKDLVQWSKSVIPLDIPEMNKDTEIWISQAKEIAKEWRLFVVDDKIISASRYMNKGELAESRTDIPEEMIRFAKGLIDEYRLADVYAMDIALSNGKYRLLECNCFNGTGFYQHDIEGIIRAVNGFIRTDKITKG